MENFLRMKFISHLHVFYFIIDEILLFKYHYVVNRLQFLRRGHSKIDKMKILKFFVHCALCAIIILTVCRIFFKIITFL